MNGFWCCQDSLYVLNPSLVCPRFLRPFSRLPQVGIPDPRLAADGAELDPGVWDGSAMIGCEHSGDSLSSGTGEELVAQPNDVPRREGVPVSEASGREDGLEMRSSGGMLVASTGKLATSLFWGSGLLSTNVASSNVWLASFFPCDN